MARGNGLGALAISVALLGAVGGCAVYGECGRQECPEETALRVAVEQRFSGYPQLRPPNQLYVQVRGHVVSLSGQVNSEVERRLAESVAREVPGITKVSNLIALSYSGR